MNILFMIVVIFLFFFGFIFVGKLITSRFVTYCLSVKFGDDYITPQMKRDTYMFGVVADLAAIGIVSSALIIFSNIRDSSIIEFDIPFLQYYYCLFIYAIYPNYTYIGVHNDSFAESFYIILALIAVSLIASCIMYYFCVFRKSELSKPRKFY